MSAPEKVYPLDIGEFVPMVPRTPSPTGTELALDEAKRHIVALTAFWMDNPEWTKAANEARAFISGVPTSST